MVFVYCDDTDFYNEIYPAIPVKSKQIVNYDFLQNNLNNAELIILDGEKRENGAMSFIKESELTHKKIPPTIVITSKKEDDWLSKWAGASKVIQKPLDPFELTNAINECF
jgi:DNA-binding response OmpR family regulator